MRSMRSKKKVTISLGKHTPEDMKELLKDKTITSIKIDDDGEEKKARFEWSKRQRSFHLGWLTGFKLEELMIDADVSFNTLIELNSLDLRSLKRLSLRISHRNFELYRYHYSNSEWFEPLSRCESLEELRIQTDHHRLDLSALSACEGLQSIDLSSSDIVGVTLPSCLSLEHINLSHTNMVSKYMMENWWAPYEKEFLWIAYTADNKPHRGGIPRAATVYTVVGQDKLLDLSQVQACTSLKTIDLSSCEKLHSIDLSVFVNTGVRPKVILIKSPIYQYCIDGFEGKVVLPKYDSARMKHPPIQIGKHGQEVQ